MSKKKFLLKKKFSFFCLTVRIFVCFQVKLFFLQEKIVLQFFCFCFLRSEVNKKLNKELSWTPSGSTHIMSLKKIVFSKNNISMAVSLFLYVMFK